MPLTGKNLFTARIIQNTQIHRVDKLQGSAVTATSLIQIHVTRQRLHKHEWSDYNKAVLRPEFHYIAAVRPTDASKEEKIRQTDEPAQQQFGAE